MNKLAWLLLAGLALSACKADKTPNCNELAGAAPVDPVLLAFLSSARAAHHLADEREDAKDLKGALGPLQKLVSGPVPKTKGPELAPEVREVLSDTRARMADLESQLGEFERALEDVARGLDLAREPTYFRGHLFETRGLVHERHAKALKATDPAAAADAEKLAVSALEEAMAIQGGVIQNGAPAQPPDASAAPKSAQ